MKAPLSRLLVWFTWTYWGRLVDFIRLAKYLETPRTWYEIRNWHRRYCKHMRLAFVRYLLKELESQEWVEQKPLGTYVLAERGRQEIERFLKSLSELLLETYPPRRKSQVFRLLVQSGWFDEPRTAFEVARRLECSVEYAYRLLAEACKNGVLTRRREDRVYVYSARRGKAANLI